MTEPSTPLMRGLLDSTSKAMQILRKVVSPLFPALVGLISGFLTIASYHFSSGPVGDYYVVGLIFGLAIAVYLSIARYSRQFWKVSLILATSIVAYRLGTLSYLLGQTEYLGYFIGGCVGSLLISTAIFLLTSLPRTKWLVICILLSAVAGGVFGATGYLVSPFFGRHLSGALDRLHLSSTWGMLESMRDPVFSVHMIWQTGMAFAIGLILKRLSEKNSGVPLQKQHYGPALRFFPVVFFGAILLFLAFQIGGDLKEALQQDQQKANAPQYPIAVRRTLTATIIRSPAGKLS